LGSCHHGTASPLTAERTDGLQTFEGSYEKVGQPRKGDPAVWKSCETLFTVKMQHVTICHIGPQILKDYLERHKETGWAEADWIHRDLNNNTTIAGFLL